MKTKTPIAISLEILAAVIVAYALGTFTLLRLQFPTPWLPQANSSILVGISQMIPIFIIAFRWGSLPTCTAGAALGLLCFYSAPIPKSTATLVEYVLGFGALGIAALFNSYSKNSLARISLAMLSGSLIRLFVLIGCGSYGTAGLAAKEQGFLNIALSNSIYMAFEFAVCVIFIAIAHIFSRGKITQYKR